MILVHTASGEGAFGVLFFSPGRDSIINMPECPRMAERSNFFRKYLMYLWPLRFIPATTRAAFPLAIQGDGLVILLIFTSHHGFVICVGTDLSQVGWRGKRCEGHRGFCAVVSLLTGMLVGVHTMVWMWYESRKNSKSSGGGKPRAHWGRVFSSSFDRDRVDRMSDRVTFPKTSGGGLVQACYGQCPPRGQCSTFAKFLWVLCFWGPDVDVCIGARE